MSAARSAVVVGGGVAGLATAALLARDGWSVDLLERSDAVGGRAGTWESGGFRFDTGPSWLLMPEVFERFFAEAGTALAERLDLATLDPAYRVLFEEGEPLEVVADRAANLATFEAAEAGAGARLDRYLRSARSTYDIALRRFLYTSFDAPGQLLHPDVALRGHRLAPLLLRSLESFVARRFREPRLRQVLGYPAVFLGTSPDRAPSMYHLMSALDLEGGVRYPRGGFGRLVGALADVAREAGVRLRTGWEATAVTTRPADDGDGARAGRAGRRAAVTGVRCTDPTGTEHHLPATLVVGAADLHHVETQLLPEALQTYPERWWRHRDPGPGGVLAMLGVRGRVPELAHHTLLFTRDWRRNFADIAAGVVPEPASAYVCAPSRTDPTVAPPGHENLFVLVPVPADPGLGRGGVAGRGDPAVERVADAAIDQIARWAGVPDLADRVVVRRTVGPGDFAADLHAWRGGMLGPGHTLRQSAFLRAGNASRKVAGLYYAGSGTIPGVGLPMCLISAEILRDRVRRDLGAGGAGAAGGAARGRAGGRVRRPRARVGAP
ncbi:phytoene desaturase family protein [Puerhibacterium sp. TATVAM-FAB25]|uniref:phytoene desaturase family protein n=1 Tax=Puerhibacterium sp. TATVAM-FAB25 TaxID=3093699 RepID=UPI003979BC9C